MNPDKIDGPGVARWHSNLHVWCWQHRAFELARIRALSKTLQGVSSVL